MRIEHKHCDFCGKLISTHKSNSLKTRITCEAEGRRWPRRRCNVPSSFFLPFTSFGIDCCWACRVRLLPLLRRSARFEKVRQKAQNCLRAREIRALRELVGTLGKKK